MLEIFQKWYERYFFEEGSILLLVLLAVGLVLLLTIGDILTPVLAAIVLAFLMQGLAVRLMAMGATQWLAVSCSFTVFVGFFFGALFVLLPMIWQQVVALFGELPRMIEQVRIWLAVLPEQYPTLITEQQISKALALAQERWRQLRSRWSVFLSPLSRSC